MNIHTLFLHDIYGYLLVFCRLGTVLMFLPGFGTIAVKVRLMVALLLTMVIWPSISLPPYPDNSFALGLLVVQEVLIGAFLGVCFQLTFYILETAGSMISLQIGLSNASIFNPALATSTSLPGTILSFSAMVLVFIMDIHHNFIAAIVDSYGAIPPVSVELLPDMARTLADLMSSGFTLALQISAPLLIGVTILFSALGLLNRLMPAMQIFFVAQPLQIALGLLTFMITLAPALMAFLRYLDVFIHSLLTVRGAHG